jgi:hypothetical protein
MTNRRISNLRIDSNNQVGKAGFINPVSEGTIPILEYGYNLIVPGYGSFAAIMLPPAISGSVVIGVFAVEITDAVGIISYYDKNTETYTDSINFGSIGQPFIFPSLPVSNSQTMICICSQTGVWSGNFAAFSP